jgi:hypothetical protein
MYEVARDAPQLKPKTLRKVEFERKNFGNFSLP